MKIMSVGQILNIPKRKKQTFCSVSFSSSSSFQRQMYKNNKYTTPLYGNSSLLESTTSKSTDNWYCSFFNKPINIDTSRCSSNRATVLSQMQNCKLENGNPLFSSGYLLRYMNQFLVSEELIDNILKRNLVNSKLKNPELLNYLALMNDDLWENVKDFAYILEPSVLENCAIVEASIDEFLVDYQKQKILSLISSFPHTNKDLASQVQTIYNSIKKSGVESSNLTMMLDLIGEGKLSPIVLLNYSDKYKMNPNTEADLDKLYDAYINNKDVKSVFVPSFKTSTEAINSLSIGDVCKLDYNANISIKTSTNELEDLFITPETFLELFPPVERYNFNQGDSGDCFFCAPIDSIFQNPKFRNRILNRFKENKDGTVDLCIDGYKKENGKILKFYDNSFELKDISKQIGSSLNGNYFALSQQCEGLRALEVMYNHYKLAIAKELVKNKYDEVVNLLNSCNDDVIKYADFYYSREELEDFIYFSEKSLYSNEIDTDDIMVPVQNKFLGLIYPFNPNYVFNSELFKFSAPDEISYMRKIEDRYSEYIKRTGEKTKLYDEILPINVYRSLELIKYPNLLYLQGGSLSHVLETFGFKSKMYKSKDIMEMGILDSKNFSNDYVVCCGISKNTDSKYMNNHAYSLDVKDSNGKREYILRNPYDSSFYLPISKEELLEKFDTFWIGEI